jgi:hypothetical protein
MAHAFDMPRFQNRRNVPSSAGVSDELFIREALRVYERYATEVVEGLDICPWASRARADGRVATRFVLASSQPEEEALEVMLEVANDPLLEVGLVIFPKLMLDRRGFDALVTVLRRRDGERWPEGRAPLVLASFHPEAEPHTETPYRLVPFLRRTPDPTIQLVRHSVISALRKPGESGTDYVDLATVDLKALLAMKKRPPLHERVAINNLDTVQREGVDRVRAIFDDILADRNRSYAAFGVPAR